MSFWTLSLLHPPQGTQLGNLLESLSSSLLLKRLNFSLLQKAVSDHLRPFLVSSHTRAACSLTTSLSFSGPLPYLSAPSYNPSDSALSSVLKFSLPELPALSHPDLSSHLTPTLILYHSFSATCALFQIHFGAYRKHPPAVFHFELLSSPTDSHFIKGLLYISTNSLVLVQLSDKRLAH